MKAINWRHWQNGNYSEDVPNRAIFNSRRNYELRNNGHKEYKFIYEGYDSSQQSDERRDSLSNDVDDPNLIALIQYYLTKGKLDYEYVWCSKRAECLKLGSYHLCL